MVQMMQRSPQVAELGSLVQMMQTSPQVTAQLALNARLAAGATAVTQRVEGEEDELLQGKFDTVQRFEGDEEELLQGKFVTVQRFEGEDEEPLQGKFAPIQRVAAESAPAPSPNQTGLPNGLKSGIESLSGISLDQVRVHYNSSQPAQLNAHAYAQGSEIHLAPGQEQHLPHEAWHVVQQAQGRVKPTMQLKDGVPVNDEAGLEGEADVMGAKAAGAVNLSDPLEIFQRRVETAETHPQLDPTGDQGSLNFLSSASSSLVQKAEINTSTTYNIVQLKRIDVVTNGITHLVQINSTGSLYQEEFRQNEVAETEPGDSVVIESDLSIRSRRGPHQEQTPFNLESESNHVWINAVTHNDERLPKDSFIRDGTFVKRDRPKIAFNLASGTVPDTLMHLGAEQQEVLNLDSGHMAVADAVCDCRQIDAVIKVLADLLFDKNPNEQFGLSKKITTKQMKLESLILQMQKEKSFSTNLKLLLHISFPGRGGVQAFLDLMPDIVKATFFQKLNSLDKREFIIGDIAKGSEIAQTSGQADVVHMVNAFGFDPIQDRIQVNHLATILRQGGRLVITAEKTGPTVSPLLIGMEEPMSAETIVTHVSRILSNTELGVYFSLGPQVYPHGMPVTYGTKSDVMGRNSLTDSMRTTRHTMPSGDTTDMPESITVQITFVRNDAPLENAKK